MADRTPGPSGQTRKDHPAATMTSVRQHNNQARLRTELSRIKQRISKVEEENEASQRNAERQIFEKLDWHKAQIERHLEHVSYHQDYVDGLKRSADDVRYEHARMLDRDIAQDVERCNRLNAKITTRSRVQNPVPSSSRQSLPLVRRDLDNLDLMVRSQIARQLPPAAPTQLNDITTANAGERANHILKASKRWPDTWPHIISDSFPVVVNIDHQPQLISCIFCAANCDHDGTFFNGLQGLLEHVQFIHHNEADLRHLEAWCELKSVCEEDVDSLEQGHHTIKHGINRKKSSRNPDQPPKSTELPSLPVKPENASAAKTPSIPRTESTTPQRNIKVLPRAPGELGQGRAEDHGPKKRKGATPEGNPQLLRPKKSRNQLGVASDMEKEDKENQPSPDILAEG